MRRRKIRHHNKAVPIDQRRRDDADPDGDAHLLVDGEDLQVEQENGDLGEHDARGHEDPLDKDPFHEVAVVPACWNVPLVSVEAVHFLGTGVRVRSSLFIGEGGGDKATRTYNP